MQLQREFVVLVVEGKADPAEMRTLRDLLSHLSVCVVSKKSKNIEVLHIAAEVCDIFRQNFQRCYRSTEVSVD